MTDEIIIEGKSYVSSKRASELSEYAQDYIGQLARGGYVDCQRVGGLWYISMPSLFEYKKNAEKERPSPSEPKVQVEPESLVFFDGKEFISASRASKLSGYTQDYVGQLARAGKVLSRQVGNRWYIDHDGILDHKKEKDALLAAVQRESVGIIVNGKQTPIEAVAEPIPDIHFTYSNDKADLLPPLPEKETLESDQGGEEADFDEVHHVPIRVRSRAAEANSYRDFGSSKVYPIPGNSLKDRKKVPLKQIAAVLAISLGFLSIGGFSIWSFMTYRSNQASVLQTGSSSIAGGRYLEAVGEFFENILVSELFYQRPVQR